MSILVLHRHNASRRGHLVRAAEHARARGRRFLLLVENPTWEAELADVVVSVDTSDVEATVAVARRLAASEPEPVEAVAAFVGHSVPAAAAVAAALGLPFVSEHTARTVRDKHAMRAAFEAAGVPQPAFGLATTVDEARTLAERLGFPLVLKPLVDNDTGHLRRVDTPDELAEHLPEVLRGAWEGIEGDRRYGWLTERYPRAVIVEQYLPGAEVSVESVVVEGRTHVVAIHDKPLASEGPYFVDTLFTTPSRLPADVQRRVAEVAAAAHRAVGIESGAAHTELRVQADGTPKVLETAARLGGGPIHRSVLLSTGVDLVAAVLDVAAGREPDLTPRPEATPAGFRLVFAERAGTVRAVTGVAEAELDPRVHEVSLYRGPGDAVDVPPRVWQSHGHVVFTADSPAGLARAADELGASLRFELEAAS
ncbi:ATP-grasp domain-containing protein [Cellulomonas sp. NPDC055163]